MSNIILGTIDAGGDGPAVLLAAVNAAIGSNFTLNDVEFAAPELVSTPQPLRNSVIKMAPKASSGYYGVRRIFYNRIHVSELGVISVPRASAVNVSDLLTDISYKYGILIKPEDIYDAVLPPAAPGVPSVEINFNFRPTSVIYYGDTKIQLGTNDPSGGNTGGSTLFVPVQTLFGYAEEVLPGNKTKIDVFSTTVDQDKSRKRMGIVQASDAVVANVYNRSWPNGYKDAGKVKTAGWPLVASWTAADGSVRVADVYGTVLQKDATSTGWGEKISSIVALDFDQLVNVNQVQEQLSLKAVLQSFDGKLYAITRFNGDTKIFLSEDSGTTWTQQNDFDPEGDSSVLFTDFYTSGGYIRDSMFHAGKLWFLLDTGGTLAVEVIDLGTKEPTFYPLNMMVRNTGQQIDEFSVTKVAFSIPLPTMAYPGIVALGRLSGTLQPRVFQFTAVGSAYLPHAVKHDLLDFDVLDRPETYVVGHSAEIVKNPQWRMDTIEIGTAVPSQTPNTEFALVNQNRTKDNHKTYGVVTLTSIVSASGSTKWVQTNVALGASAAPSPVRLHSLGRYMNYHIQPENALARIRYVENTVTGGFDGVADNSILVEKSAQLRNTLRFGSAAYTKPGLEENTFTAYQFEAAANDDSTKPVIGRSFIGKNSAAVNVWFTAGTTNDPLVRRVMGLSNSAMGETPLALANMGTDLYFFSRSQMIFRSNDQGLNWASYADFRTFYKDIAVMPGQSLMSTAPISLDVGSLKMGSFQNDTFVLEVQHATTANVFDVLGKDLSATKNLNTKLLFKFTPMDALAADGYSSKGLNGSYGVNFTGDYQPIRVNHYYVEFGNNAAHANVDYTEDAALPYGETNDDTDILQTIPVGFTVVDVKKDVLYLDVKEVVYGYTDSSVWKLLIRDKDDNDYEIPLYGGTKPANAGFKPDISFYLWDAQETNYVPLVYYTDKAVMLLQRLVEDGTFSERITLLTVPQDNGATLRALPMYNKNRREYWFYQKGNGIFRLNSLYNPVNRETSFTLVKQHSLSEVGLNDVDLFSGMAYGLDVAVPPTVALVPVFPPNGQLINSFCDGTTKKGNYHDGVGGQYEAVIETDSVDCGYVAPTPGPVAAPTASIIVNTDTNGVIHTETTTDEQGNAYVVYAFSNPLTADTDMVVDLAHVTTSGGDFTAFDWRYDENGWNTLTMGTPITIPAGAIALTVRVTYVDDAAAEGDETYILVLDKAPGNTQITSAAIETTITITDPAPAPTSAVWSLRTSGMTGPSGNATTNSVNEGSYAYLVYELSNALAEDVEGPAISISSAHLGDLESIDIYQEGAGNWVPFSMNSHPTILAGQTTVTYRIKLYPDATTEGAEVMTVTGAKSTSDVRVTGPATIDHEVTINDTSNGLATGPAEITLETGFTGEAGHATSSGNLDEGSYAYIVYKIDPPIGTDITEPTVSVTTGSGSAVPADVTVERFNYVTGNWTLVSDGDNVFIPAGAEFFTLRVYLKLDFETEAAETLTVTMAMNQGTQTTGANVSHTVTINANAS